MATDFNQAAEAYGPKNDAEKKLLDALSKGGAGKGVAFGCMMQGASLSATSNKAGEEGWTPLMYAMKSGNEELIEFLLHFNVPVDDRNKEGDTALSIVIKNRRKSGDEYAMDDFYRARQLIRAYEDDRTANLNLQDRQGMTALMLAASTGQWDFVTRILEAGADPYIEAPDGKRAIDFARAQPDSGNYRAADAIRLLEESERRKQRHEAQIDAGLPTDAPVTVGKPPAFKFKR